MPPRPLPRYALLRPVLAILLVVLFASTLPLATAGSTGSGHAIGSVPGGLAGTSRPWTTGKLGETTLTKLLSSFSGPKAGPEVLASGSQQGAGTWEAVDPVTHYIYVVWQSDYGIGFSRSIDGGASFQPAITVPGSADTFTNTSYNFSFNPTVAVSFDGTVYVGFAYSSLNLVTFGTPSGAPMVSVSYNHGASFAFTSVVAHLSPTSFTDSPFVAAGPGRTVDMTWAYAPNGSTLVTDCDPLLPSCGYGAGELNAVFAQSVNGGRTWGRMVAINPGYPYGGGDSDPLVVEPNGQIDVLYQGYEMNHTTYALGDGREYFTASSDGGRSWSVPVEVGNPLYITNDTEYWLEGHLAIGSDGTLYAVWDTQAPLGDIGSFSYSTDGGHRWSAPIRVTTNASAVHLMAVVAGDAGTAYIGWIANADVPLGWSGYVTEFSTLAHHLETTVRVNSLYSLPGLYTGDTVGLAYLGHDEVSMAWGIELNTTGNLSENVYNVVVDMR